ncbi:MAG: AAA family ATPase, partial [Desulfobacterales bacterium]|nr:AAA family ATPase [Desulfobacterales bacterium]
ENALKGADAAVLLISADFLTSDFIMKEEVPILLRKKAESGLPIFPMLVKQCPWKKVKWLERLNIRPTDGKPLAEFPENKIDSVLTSLVEEIDARLTSHAPKGPISPDRIFTSKLPVTSKELYGREPELEALDNAWSDEKTRVLTLVGWGGVGKSALVNHWLNRMDRDNFRGAARVYGWSFYSQGTSEDRQVSADEFFDFTLRWFGDPDPAQGAAWEKGVRLAGLLRSARTLLLLDGLEPLQYPPGEMHGHLKDQGLKALLREMARSNDGLCVITTRTKVGDLANFTGRSVKNVLLEN